MGIENQEDPTLLEMHPLSQEEETLKLKILHTLRRFSVQYDESDLNELLEKSVTRCKSTCPEQRLEFAYVMTRNWCMDRIRTMRSMTQRSIAQILDAQQHRKAATLNARERAAFLLARDEYRTLVAKLIYEPGEENFDDELRGKLRISQIGQLGMLYFTIFEQESDEELAVRYPDTQRDLRYQWRKRARDLLYPHASENLLTFLDCKNLHNKHKKTHLMSL